MGLEEILDTVRRFDGVLELAPKAGSEFPKIAWGDHFFYYAPDGRVPQREQPYATIVTKNYPDDEASDLDPPDRWRLNIHVGTKTLGELIGDPAAGSKPADPAAADVIIPHPLYHKQGWISIINPGPRTGTDAVRLLHEAHQAARRRWDRRHEVHPQ